MDYRMELGTWTLPDGVTHGAHSHATLPTLRRHALRHPDGADSPRLGADDVHRCVGLRRVLQQVLRHLRGLPASRLTLNDGHRVIGEGVDERPTVEAPKGVLSPSPFIHYTSHPIRVCVRACVSLRTTRSISLFTHPYTLALRHVPASLPSSFKTSFV